MTLPEFPDQNRPDRGVIAISGETALGWLDNLLTCGVGTLGAGTAAYGALLTPQGKILHDMFIFNTGERVLIDCAAEQRTDLLKRLVIYRLRAKLMIELDNEIEVGVHMEPPSDGLNLRDPRHPDMGWRSFQSAGALINVPASRGYDERRITLGLADSVQDIGVEKLFPHEANFDQMQAVDFRKGCYVGQEVVSRMQHRGTARNRILPVRVEGTLAERQVISGGKVIGEVLSVAGNHALALIRIDRLAEASAPLMAGNAKLHVTKPAWITYDVTIPEAAQ
jgi:tRNA-modifying protein YgfZ